MEPGVGEPCAKQGFHRLPSVCSRSPELEPPSRAALRTLSLAKDEFLKQAWGSGTLTRISISACARASPGGLYSTISTQEDAAGSPAPAGPASGAVPGGACAVQLGDAGPPTPRAPQRPDPPLSILGLPIVSCRDQRYLWWVLLVLLLDLTYSAFLLPLSIGFQARGCMRFCVSDLEWTWACVVDLVVGAAFFVELLLGFHVSYFVSNSGQQREMRGGRAVARYYFFHGTYWQDAISTAVWLTQIVLLLVCHAGGVEIDESASAFQYVRLVRLVRFVLVVRQLFVLTVGSGAGSLVPGLRVPPRLSHALNVAYSSLVLLHSLACLWNWIAIKEGFEGTWLNPIPALVRQYSADGAGVLTADELAAVPGAHRYVAGLYFSTVTIATLGYGDVVPTNTLEYLVDCGVIAVGVLMFGLAMGSLAEAVSNSSKEARQAQLFRDKMEGVNAWLHSSSMPGALKHRIRAYYSDIWLRHAAAKANAAEQFLELPHALRQEVAWESNRKLLARLPLFRDLDGQQRFALSGMLVPVDLTPGQELCLHGDPADRFWLLHEGEVQVFDECDIVGVVAAPAVLGVEALLQHVDAACAARPHGFRTASAAQLWACDLEDLMPWLLQNTAVLDALSCRAQAQRELQQASFAAGGSDKRIPSQSASAAEQAAEMGAQQQAQTVHAMPASQAEEAATYWTISSSGVTPDASAAQLPAEAEAQGGGALAGDPAAPATRGELQQLQGEVVSRLEALAGEISRAMAAASLAQSVAAGGRGGHGHRHAGGSPRPGSPSGLGAAALVHRRRQWNYGQLTAI